MRAAVQSDNTAPAAPAHGSLGHSFIRHPLADKAIKDLDRLFRTPPSAEHGWAGLLLGPTGSGKSAVLRAFCSKHKPTHNPRLMQPVVSVELPDKCTARALSDVLLEALGHPASGSLSIPEMQKAAVAHLQRQNTKLIIFDEAQHALRGDSYEVANFFKHILNRAKINIVFAGLPSTAGLLKNAQLKDRGVIQARLRAFDWWDPADNEVFNRILKQLQRMARYPVLGFNLFDEDYAWRLAYGSKGLMRPIVKLLISLEGLSEDKDPPLISSDMLGTAWDELPTEDRNCEDNPFGLKAMPAQWKPADSRTGERGRANGK
jgi:hypothetical protein